MEARREKVSGETRVLVFPAGTEIGLEVHRGLTGRHDLTVIGASGDDSHAPYIFKHFRDARHIGQSGWLEDLRRIISEEAVDYLYPTHDEAVYLLTKPENQVGAPVVASPIETCEVCRFKSKTYKALQDLIPVPKFYSSAKEVDSYPVFIKPDRGQGSRGTAKIQNREELDAVDLQDKLILQYLPGEEFTIDCFSDRDRGLLFAEGRVRRRVNGGISVRTERVENPEFRDYAEKIASRIEFHGAWFFQLKYGKDGRLYLLEVAPRVAGAMAYYRAQGINFPLLSVYEAQRKRFSVEPQLIPGLKLDRALYNRYSESLIYDSVYFDLDDTLIVRGEVNTQLVRFIYQCINRKIPVKLITRHKFDVEETLKRHRLLGIFDEIIHIQDHSPKSGFITGSNPIFIDDSFSERSDVSKVRGIKTFDPSMIELLIDDRV